MSDTLPLAHIDQLQVGVFISLDMPWLDHPFLVNSFLIKNEGQLKTLREMGLRTVAFDPSRCEARPRVLDHEPPLPEPPQLPPADQQVMEEKRTRSKRMLAHRQRISDCEKAYANCVASTKDVIADILRDPVVATQKASAMVGTLATTFLEEQGASVMLVASRKLDESAYQHALNVMVLTMLLGKGLGLPRKDFEAAGMGALLHDIGKSRINSSVLRNPQRGRHEESLYRMHCDYGLQLVGEHLGPDARAAIRQHHEMADGSGFPEGLVQARIHPAARMVAIANHYDNLCNPLRLADALTPAEALSHMFARQSARFDASMLASFVKQLGVYPPGSFVRLSTGSIAIVIAVTPGNTLKPTVLVYEPGVPRREALVINLAEVEDVVIECVLKPASLAQQVIEYLNPRMRLAYFAHKAGA